MRLVTWPAFAKLPSTVRLGEAPARDSIQLASSCSAAHKACCFRSRYFTTMLNFSAVRRHRKGLTIAFATATVLLIVTVYLFPLYWMVVSSLESLAVLTGFPPQLFPSHPQFADFPRALTFFPFGRYFLNTAFIVALEIPGAIASSALAGYAFARVKSPGKRALFPLVIATLIVPYTAIMIPQYILFSKLGWVNSYLPLIVPAYFGLPFLIFLFRQFFKSIPAEVYEAAAIDGCGAMAAFWRIALPLSKPAITAAAIFNLVAVWGDFLPQLLYINSASKDTVALGLANFTSSYGETPWNLVMAASLTVALVPVLAFVFGQRYLLNGIVVTTK